MPVGPRRGAPPLRRPAGALARRHPARARGLGAGAAAAAGAGGVRGSRTGSGAASRARRWRDLAALAAGAGPRPRPPRRRWCSPAGPPPRATSPPRSAALARMRALTRPPRRDRGQFAARGALPLPARPRRRGARPARGAARPRLRRLAGADRGGELAPGRRRAPAPRPRRAALAALNAVFRRFGLQEVAKRDPARPLGLDNLAGARPRRRRPASRRRGSA